jgi:hypothetical protein
MRLFQTSATGSQDVEMFQGSTFDSVFSIQLLEMPQHPLERDVWRAWRRQLWRRGAQPSRYRSQRDLFAIFARALQVSITISFRFIHSLTQN